MIGNHGRHDLTRHQKNREIDREINRYLRSIAGHHNERNANGKAAQRRRNQMLRGQLKAENGVQVMTASEADALVAALGTDEG